MPRIASTDGSDRQCANLTALARVPPGSTTPPLVTCSPHNRAGPNAGSGCNQLMSSDQLLRVWGCRGCAQVQTQPMQPGRNRQNPHSSVARAVKERRVLGLLRWGRIIPSRRKCTQAPTPTHAASPRRAPAVSPLWCCKVWAALHRGSSPPRLHSCR